MQRGKKSLNDFKFGTFIGHFLNDSAASTVCVCVCVKGLS